MKMQLVQRKDTYHIAEVYAEQVTSFLLKESRHNLSTWGLQHSLFQNLQPFAKTPKVLI